MHPNIISPHFAPTPTSPPPSPHLQIPLIPKLTKTQSPPLPSTTKPNALTPDASSLNFTLQQSLILQNHPKPFVSRILFNSPPIPNSPIPSFVDPDIISQYVQKGWISKPLSPPTIFSHVFTIIQKEKPRFIFNCKYLNHFVKSPRFKLEDLRSLQRLVQANDYFVKLDLSKAYHQVSIHPLDRHFLAFMANGTIYQFNVLPFGLSSAPFILTKALKQIIFNLRQKGIRLLIYLDDIILMAQSATLLSSHLNTTVNTLNTAGWEINFDKCLLTPTQQIDFIGAHVTSSPHIHISLTTESHAKFQSSIRSLIRIGTPKTRLVRSTLGTINWAIRFNNVLKIFKSNLQSQLIFAIKRNLNKIHLSDQTIQDLQLLLSFPLSQFSMDTLTEADLIISSDATPSSLAASIRDQHHILDTTSLPDFSADHINIKECRAVLLALRTFSDLIPNKTLLIAVDNQVTLYNLRSASSPHPLMHHLIRQIYTTLLHHRPSRVWFSYIRSNQNVLSDDLSRPGQENWSLNFSIFQQICNHAKFFPHLELFADDSNNLLPNFVSFLPNRRASFSDAFSRNWASLPPLYANPPFSLLLRVLQKAIAEKPDLMLIAPYWPTRPWFPLLLKANALYRLPRHRLTFSFLGKPAQAPNWTPLIAIFRKNRQSSFREGHPKLIQNIPYIKVRPDIPRSFPLHDRKPRMDNHPTLPPSDLPLFHESMNPLAMATRSSIVI
jgi:hypothetical protein